MSAQTATAFIGSLRAPARVRTGVLTTVFVAVLLLAGKGLGFAREVFIARLFGVTPLADAYVASMSVLQLVVWLGAALQLSVVPYFVAARERQSQGYAGRAATSTLWIAAGAGLLLSVCAWLGAPGCVRIAMPGLAPETGRLATAMMRMLAPIGLASVLGGVTAGFQNANNRFVVARLYEPTVALVSLLSVVLIGSHDGVAALAGSQTLGYATAALVLLVSVVPYIGFTRPLPLWPVGRRLFSLCWPTAGALVLFRANASVNKAFASALPGGSLASLGYAERLYLLPVTLVIATIVTFHYTRAAELSVRNDIEGIARQTVRASLKATLVLIPLTVVIAVFALPLVRCTFQGGAFDQHAGARTAAVLAVYCIALLPHVMMELLTATMRGLGNMKAPMLAGAATLGVNALLCAFLVRRLGAPGAAASLVGGYLAGAIVMAGFVVRSFRRARQTRDQGSEVRGQGSGVRDQGRV